MKDRMDEIRSTASPTLREDQIEVLMRYGETRKTEAGQVLSRAGDASNDFIVVLEGALEVVDDFAGEARIIVIQRAGGFVGELNMLTGQARYVSVMVREGGEVLAIPPERLKEVVTEESNLSDIILKAFLARRSWEMRNGGTGLRLVARAARGTRRASGSSRLATGCPTFGSSSRMTLMPKPCSRGSAQSHQRRRWPSGRAKTC